MKMKHLILFLALMMCLSFAKVYYIPSAEISYTISGNGLVHVKETIHYNLICEGDKFRELYIAKPPELEIMNPSGSCTGDDCSFRVDEPGKSVSGDRELVLSLSKGCGEVSAIFEYDVKAIKLYNDTAQFYYKLWGDEWEKATKLTVNIIMPGNAAETEHFLHYSYPEKPEVIMQSNKIIIRTEQPAGQMLEINLLMPLAWFEESEYYYYDLKHSKKDIIEAEEYDRTIGRVLDKIILLAFALYFIAAPLLVAAFAYLKYGREYSAEQIGYSGIYEHEPPSAHRPAECIFFASGDYEYKGKELSNAISATLMSFVNRGIMDVEERGKDVVFRIIGENKDLAEYETDLLNYLKSKFHDEEISLKRFEKEVAPKREFYTFTKKWAEKVAKGIGTKKYMDETGYGLASKFMGAHILSIFVLMFCAASAFSFEQFILLMGGLFIDIGIMISLSKKSVYARWTKEGRLLNLKWNNFKKYLADFSALEEHPPASVKLWDEYMTYAIALDVAEKTIKAMKKVAPQFIPKTKVARVYGSGYVAYALASSVRPTYTPSSGSSSMGGFGGGFGGGGGGAR